KRIAVIDPDARRFQPAGVATVGANSYPRAQAFPHFDFSLARAPKKSSLPIFLAIVLVVLLGAGVCAYWVLRGRTTPQPPASPGTTNPPIGPDSIIKPDLIEISGGTFQMGRNDGSPAEGPAHSVTVGSFAMD